jgi:superfamily II DNA/RNA helicase
MRNNYKQNNFRRKNSSSSSSRNRSTRKKSFKQNIHPSKFVKSAVAIKEEKYIPQNTFNDFNVSPLLHDNLEILGISVPTPIQDQAIIPALEGSDILGIASTGTGKTIAFGIPILNKLISQRGHKALIVAPTRELAAQIENELKKVGKGSGLLGALLIGGTSMHRQLSDLKTNPEIVIGTPGRIKDHIERGSLTLSNFNIVALDEVDRMLDMGFVDDITTILSQTAQNKQMLYFSATMDKRVREIISKFSKEVVEVKVKTSETSDAVEQDIIPFSKLDNKADILHDLLIKEPTTKAIIFDETQRSVERLSVELKSRGFKADSIHGAKTQGARQRTLRKFIENDINILVATDVAARGIDVKDVTVVINYSTPQTYDDYVHRIGRTGRAGKIGYAYTFVEARL